MARKHQARHNKEYKCTVPGCKGESEGFSTKNDLDRHNLCVHDIRTGNEVFYRCNVGPCKDKIKDWPRKDNFKSHLKRKHKLQNVDLGPFTCR